MTTAPYCQHPECHNSLTMYYRETYSWTLGAQPGVGTSHMDVQRTKVITFEHAPGARRWCRSHALIFEGVAFG